MSVCWPNFVIAENLGLQHFQQFQIVSTTEHRACPRPVDDATTNRAKFYRLPRGPNYCRFQTWKLLVVTWTIVKLPPNHFQVPNATIHTPPPCPRYSPLYDSFYMTTSCPPGYDVSEVKRKCTSPGIEDWKEQVPVTDMKNQVLHWAVHCISYVIFFFYKV